MKSLLTIILAALLTAALAACGDEADQPPAADNGDAPKLPPSVALPKNEAAEEGAPVDEPADEQTPPAAKPDAPAYDDESPAPDGKPPAGEEPAEQATGHEAAADERPDSQPDEPAKAETPADISPQARSVLERLEAAGDDYRAVKADVTYVVENRLTGDVETRNGWVAYQQSTDEQPARFRVSFDTLKLGDGRRTKQQVDYIFNGQWLTVARHNLKSLTRYQVATEGQRVEPLRIGKGPFPVPFGQKADEVATYLRAELKTPGNDAPDGSDHLLLTPRKNHRRDVNFKTLDLWVSRDSNLPVKVRTADDSHNVTTVAFEDIQTQAELEPTWFTFDKPAGWSVQVEPLK
ncbi:MAG: hypothetical protein GVY16_09700 [Planctomycetes bacterium]|jgi:hypothetical protein|nr:hypothetical protein [Phycisphaerae bacterium]NBB95995.1 hypothetical protein [Planctomycetota bacterium]